MVQDKAVMSREVAKEITSPPHGQQITPRPLGGLQQPCLHEDLLPQGGHPASSGLHSHARVLGAPRATRSSTLPTQLIRLCGARTADGAGDNFISLANEASFLPNPQHLISGAVISTPLPTSPRRLLHLLEFVHPALTNSHFHFAGSPGCRYVLTVLLQTVDQAGLLINEVMTVNY